MDKRANVTVRQLNTLMILMSVASGLMGVVIGILFSAANCS